MGTEATVSQSTVLRVAAAILPATAPRVRKITPDGGANMIRFLPAGRH